MGSDDFTIGVEEEFQLVDPASHALHPGVDDVLPMARRLTSHDEVTTELHQTQIETGTPVCRTLSEVRAELRRLREQVAAAASQHGLAIAAAGTHPSATADDGQITDKEAYRELESRYAHLAHEQQVFGCHVHVAVTERELAIATMNHIRSWLAPVLALSASSPFWEGTDTGYASYRTQVFGRWPTAGAPEPFASRAEFDDVVAKLIVTESIDDPARIYWDVRPSAKYETLEIRIADACTAIDDAVMVAGLAGALVRQCAALAAHDGPAATVRPEILRAARWRAARYGMTADLVDVNALQSAPAADVVRGLLAFVAPALEEWGEGDEVAELVERVLVDGTSAQRQRDVYRKRQSLDDVVDWLIAETSP